MRHCITRATLAAVVVLVGVAGCGSSDDPPTSDGSPPATDSTNGGDDATPSTQDGGSFTALVAQSCKRLVDHCEAEADPTGQPWKAHIVPWTQQACEQVAACMADQTTGKCFERLYTYYLCLAKIEPFGCQSCENQFQYIMGACPCLSECDPACP